MIYLNFKKIFAVINLEKRKTKTFKEKLLDYAIYLIVIIILNRGFDYVAKNYFNILNSLNLFYGVAFFFVFSTSFIFGSELILDWRGNLKLLLAAPISEIELLIGRSLFIIRSILTTHYIGLLLITILFYKIDLILYFKTLLLVFYY